MDPAMYALGAVYLVIALFALHPATSVVMNGREVENPVVRFIVTPIVVFMVSIIFTVVCFVGYYVAYSLSYPFWAMFPSIAGN
ncbi:MAG: hypothetical protein AAB908_00375 [Patescibacteria group bacterium]